MLLLRRRYRRRLLSRAWNFGRWQSPGAIPAPCVQAFSWNATTDETQWTQILTEGRTEGTHQVRQPELGSGMKEITLEFRLLRSFSRAAERLGIEQSPVSRAMRDL